MCVTTTKSVMRNTLVYAGEALLNSKYVHVIGYQNQAESKEPNAMVIPFPTEVAMTKDNIVNTIDHPSYLKDIVDSTRNNNFKGRRLSKYLGLGPDEDSLAEVFDSGSYTVILASNTSQIREALTRVPENKRPTITDSFLEGYGKLYPNQPIAVCCWNGLVKSEPLLWWYEPKDKSTLFIPTMDAHDGNAPNLTSLVYTDHIITVGSAITNVGNTVKYKDNDQLLIMKTLLPKAAFGIKLNGSYLNGDCFVKTSELSKKYYEIGYHYNNQFPSLLRGFNLDNLTASMRMTGWD